MFKSKWQKKYEQAMTIIEKQRDLYRAQADECPDETVMVVNNWQAIALSDILRDMQKIAEG